MCLPVNPDWKPSSTGSYCLTMKRILTLTSVGFLILCGALILESGLFSSPAGPPKQTPGCILLGQTNETDDQQNAQDAEKPEKNEEDAQRHELNDPSASLDLHPDPDSPPHARCSSDPGRSRRVPSRERPQDD